MSRQILITGGAGFLGSHLCERFLKEDFHVTGMDNFITGSQKNIDSLQKLLPVQELLKVVRKRYCE